MEIYIRKRVKKTSLVIGTCVLNDKCITTAEALFGLPKDQDSNAANSAIGDPGAQRPSSGVVSGIYFICTLLNII